VEDFPALTQCAQLHTKLESSAKRAALQGSSIEANQKRAIINYFK